MKIGSNKIIYDRRLQYLNKLLWWKPLDRWTSRCWKESSLPEAFPIWLWFLNPAVTAMQRTIRIQLISGIYIWLRNVLEVWTTLTLGKQPSARACLINEKVADMVAWLATIAAVVATKNTGQYILSAEWTSYTQFQGNIHTLNTYTLLGKDYDIEKHFWEG